MKRSPSIARAMHQWRKYPTRPGFCIDTDGRPVWLRPGEHAGPSDVFLDTYADNGPSWAPLDIQRLLDQRRIA